MSNEEAVFNRLAEQAKRWLKETSYSPHSPVIAFNAAPVTNPFQVNNSSLMRVSYLLPASASESKKKMKVNEFDVVCGSGKGNSALYGNVRYLELIRQYAVDFSTTRYPRTLVHNIFQIFRNRGGCFLKEDQATGDLYEISDQEAREKITKALRYALEESPKENSSSVANESKKQQMVRMHGPTNVQKAALVIDPPRMSTAPPSVDPVRNATTSQSSECSINEFDVVCTKGRFRRKQDITAGNARYNQLIHDFAHTFSRGTLSQKKEYVRHVLQCVQGQGGRFLKTDKATGEIQELDDMEAFEKVRAALVYRSRENVLEAELPE